MEINCDHPDFKTHAKIIRKTIDGKITSFRAEVKIQCKKCGTFFKFPVYNIGMDENVPTADLSQTELRIPIKPSNIK